MDDIIREAKDVEIGVVKIRPPTPDEDNDNPESEVPVKTLSKKEEEAKKKEEYVVVLSCLVRGLIVYVHV